MRDFEFISHPSRETEWEQTCTLGKSIEEIDYINKKKLSTVYKKKLIKFIFFMRASVAFSHVWAAFKESAKNSSMNSHSISSFRWWKTSFKIQKSCFPNVNAESRKPIMFSKIGLVYQSCLGIMIANFFFHWHGTFNTSDTILTFILE